MAAKSKTAGVADEGGWWPVFDSNEEALETLVAAIEKAGERPGERVVISLDIAASEFGKDGRYRLALEDREMDSDELIDMLGALARRLSYRRNRRPGRRGRYHRHDRVYPPLR